MPSEKLFIYYARHEKKKGRVVRHTPVFEEHGYFEIVSTTLPASTEPFKFIQMKRYLMFIGEVYWK